MVVMGTTVCGMGWLTFDFVRHMPRNSDGSVTIFGVFNLPASIVGEIPRPTDVVTTDPLPEVKEIPGAPTHGQLEGVWKCDKNVAVTFTETGRVALKNEYGYTFPNTAFETWRDETYAFVSPRTIRVGGKDANLEIGKDQQSLRIFSGKHVFECMKDVF